MYLNIITIAVELQNLQQMLMNLKFQNYIGLAAAIKSGEPLHRVMKNDDGTVFIAYNQDNNKIFYNIHYNHLTAKNVLPSARIDVMYNRYGVFLVGENYDKLVELLNEYEKHNKTI